MYPELETVLDTYVRPKLLAHEGNLEVISVEDGIVRFRLLGRCAGCPSADLTTEELIQAELVEHLPGIQKAVLVNAVSDNLIQEAKDILRMRHR